MVFLRLVESEYQQARPQGNVELVGMIGNARFLSGVYQRCALTTSISGAVLKLVARVTTCWATARSCFASYGKVFTFAIKSASGFDVCDERSVTCGRRFQRHGSGPAKGIEY
jgi:hypothetical protein